MSRWPMVQLGEIITQDKSYIESPEPRIYPKLSVKLYGRGVELDSPADGALIKMARHQLAKAGQIILSEIWAKKGAIGIVPPEGAGSLCTSHFFLFDIDQSKADAIYIKWLLHGNYFEPQLSAEAKGTTGYAAVRPKHFMAATIPLPPLEKQQAIIARLDTLSNKVRQVNEHLNSIERDAEHLLALRFRDAINNAPLRAMGEIAPPVRRSVTIDIETRYREIGARSFGKGLFVKPDFEGAEVTWQKPVWIEAGDLVLSNIKAWEGAIAIARKVHSGCIASHRYITCVPDKSSATVGFLHYFLLSPEGLEQVGLASPGTADRNRTLSLTKLGKIEIPVPSLAVQKKFDALQAKVAELKTKHAAIREANQALVPATLERIFAA